ncbi:MAG: hypothetical protein RI101_06790 [Nitrospira sp.]|jgi:hypothetical protein|nr:hypothetical protein [Nitrospira sp.]
MIRSLPLSALSLLCLTLLSCGEESHLPSVQTDPCSLITAAEAERALGERVQAGALTDPNTCVFKASRNNSNAVTVQVDETAGKDRRTWFNKERLRRDSDLLPGLADGAVRVYSPPSLARLSFIRGQALVTVMVSSLSQTNLPDSVTQLGKMAAARYGGSTFVAGDSAGSVPPSAPAASMPPAATARTSQAAMTQTLPAVSGTSSGPAKSVPIDLAGLTGTWHAHALQGAIKHELLLVIQPNRTWTLSSMMQFDGVVNADAGRWSLERSNTFKGLAWKGTYLTSTPQSFSSTGSLHATWSRLQPDQDPAQIPAELWELRHEATSVPVFQLKTVDPALVGRWEGTGTYAGGPASFVWSIKPSAAADLLIIETLRGTIVTKAGVPRLQPAQKRQRTVDIVAFHEGGLTTSDGKTSIRWTKVLPPPAPSPQL